MIRILLVGRTSAAIAAKMNDASDVEVDYAALPAAAVRQMEAQPPDLVCIVDEQVSARTDLLVQGIRARPLGQLSPIIMIAPPAPASLQTLTELVDRWLDLSVTPTEIIGHAFSLLGVDRAPDNVIAAIDDEVPYYIEEIVEVAPKPTPTRVDSTLDADAIRRKLRAVRHEDYFVILEVGRGAETTAIREAFYRLTRLFDLRSAPFEVASEFEPELLEISDAIEDAWAVMGDPDLRRVYIDETSRR